MVRLRRKTRLAICTQSCFSTDITFTEKSFFDEDKGDDLLEDAAPAQEPGSK